MQRGQAARTLALASEALARGLAMPNAVREALNAWRHTPEVPFVQILAEQLPSGSIERAELERNLLNNEEHPIRSDTTRTFAADNANLESACDLLERGDVQTALTMIGGGLPASFFHKDSAPPIPDSEPPRVGSADITLKRRSDSVASPLPGSVFPPPPGESRYHKIRSVASGGLGEVFLALDAELNREVALKEIKPKHADATNSRSRFVLEAEVTGGLEHPGIVPVYGLGQYPDGRPYYAMKLIRGETLREAVDRFHHNDDESVRAPADRDLAFRALLTKFIAVCEAMAYAHSRGVIHRDLKPANIMIGNYGETLVVDWGIAKAQGHADSEITLLEQSPLLPLSASNTAETIEGSALGTPQYMSPEQAFGKQSQVTYSSDIYSLGATLYYILTGFPPFTEMNPGLTVYKVQRGDFPAPIERDSRVPGALNAICLKAMSFKPEDRYHTCKALAHDVERWLADERVPVYREPFVARAARWARHHRTLVTTSLGLLIASTIGLSLFGIAIELEKRRTEATYVIARKAVDEMLEQLGAVDLVDVPQVQHVRKSSVEKARGFYQDFINLRGDDTRRLLDVARATRRLGDIEEMLGDYAASERNYRRALTSLDREDNLEERANALHGLGVLLKKSLRFAESERTLREALNIRSRNLVDNDAKQSRNETLYQIGTVLARQVGKRPAADDTYQEALEAQRTLVAESRDKPMAQRKLARYLNNFAILVKQAEPLEARKIFQETAKTQDELAKKSPTIAGLQWERARSHSNLGSTLANMKQYEEGLLEMRQAESIYQVLSDDYPLVPDYAVELAGTRENIAGFLNLLKRREEALVGVESAINSLTVMTVDYPSRTDIRLRLARAQSTRAGIVGNLKDALAIFDSARDTLESLKRSLPEIVNSPEFLGALASTYEGKATLRYHPDERDGRLMTAIHEDLVQAFDLYKSAGAIEPKTLTYKLNFANIAGLLIQLEIDAGSFDRASAHIQKLISARSDDADYRILAATFLATQGQKHSPDTPDREKYLQMAIDQFEEAERLNNKNPVPRFSITKAVFLENICRIRLEQTRLDMKLLEKIESRLASTFELYKQAAAGPPETKDYDTRIDAIRELQARVEIRAKRFDLALKRVEELQTTVSANPEALLEIASRLALCAESTEAIDPKRAEFLDQSLSHLERADALGVVTLAILDDREFQALRDLEAFRRLRAKVEASTQPPN